MIATRFGSGEGHLHPAALARRSSAKPARNGMAKYYNPRLGSFMSPDPSQCLLGYGTVRIVRIGPLGGSILNPQSLNRYAYALNNPGNVADPSGTKALPIYQQLEEESWSVIGDWAMEWVSSMLGSGGVEQCPNNECAIIDTNTGKVSFFVAGAGGASGYLALKQMATMNYECGSVFCTSAGYLMWAINNDPRAAASQFGAIAKKLAEKLRLSVADVMSQLITDLYGGAGSFLQGGNINFAIPGSWESSLCGASATHCRLLDGLHVHSVGGAFYVHMDTVDPFGSVGGFFEHGLVDLFLGNTVYSIIPRPL